MRFDEFVTEQELDEGVKSKAAAAALAATLGAGAQAATDWSVLDRYKQELDTKVQSEKQTQNDVARQQRRDELRKKFVSSPVAKAPVAKVAAKAPPPPQVDADPIGQLIKQRTSKTGEYSSKTVKVEPKAVAKAEPKKAATANHTAEYVPVTDNPFEPRLKKYAMKHGIANLTELAQFLGQAAHETAGFTKLEEDGDRAYFFNLYDPKGNPAKAKQLGNTERGDGERFKGRGFLHLTGRDNYTRASHAIFGDDRLVRHPELVATNPTVAAQTAIWFWNTNLKKKLADTGFKSTKAVTKIVNPGMRHAERRVTWADKFLSAFGVNRG